MYSGIKYIVLPALLGFCATTAAPARADVKPASIFGDNMVLQRDKPVPVWGTADPDEKVSVTFNGQTQTTTADQQGKWLLHLSPVKAGGPFSMDIKGKNDLTLQNVLVGEVWVCSGQSNMAMYVTSAKDGPQEIAAANYPQIRLMTVPRKSLPEPTTDVALSWQECSPQTVPYFSATAYYFGRELYRKLGVPIGLINTSVGGTVVEAWMSRAALETSDDFKPIIDRYNTAVEKYPAAKADYDAKVAAWKLEAEAAKAAGKPLPRAPVAPMGPGNQNAPNGLYNAMIYPLVPFAMRGAIWYQGESNATRAYQYRKLFPTLIADWRRQWGEGDFPFYYVQLANYLKPDAQPADSTWAELREAQTLALSTPNTGMATIVDIGEEADIHPKNKQEVGRRLALLALSKTYDQKVESAGPMFANLNIEGNKAIVHFTNAQGLKTSDGAPPKGFAIAGADKKWAWADAQIIGESVSLSSPDVPIPVAVRYAWGNNPSTNLYNAAGLPVNPFRSDDWPGVTANAK